MNLFNKKNIKDKNRGLTKQENQDLEKWIKKLKTKFKIKER